MDKYTLTITTETEDSVTSIEVDALLKETKEGRVFTYFQEGGRVDFFIDAARMIRRGDYGLELEFFKGKITDAKLFLGENVGHMPLRTLEYSVVERDNTIFIAMKYILEQEGGDQRLKVCLEAKRAAYAVFKTES